MGKQILSEIRTDAWFWVLLAFSMMFLTTGLLLPPIGEIHPSVLTGIGEVAGIGVLGTVLKAISASTDIQIQHNNTTISVGNKDAEDETKIGEEVQKTELQHR